MFFSDVAFRSSIGIWFLQISLFIYINSFALSSFKGIQGVWLSIHPYFVPFTVAVCLISNIITVRYEVRSARLHEQMSIATSYIFLFLLGMSVTLFGTAPISLNQDNIVYLLYGIVAILKQLTIFLPLWMLVSRLYISPIAQIPILLPNAYKLVLCAGCVLQLLSTYVLLL